MGGAAGHIQHIYEVKYLSFFQIKDLINTIVSNKIPLSEKIDGVNILYTFKNNKLLIARSTTHLKNYGHTALSINEFKQYLKDKNSNDKITDIFIQSSLELEETLIKLNNPNILQNGKLWINAEILEETNENVICYNVNQLLIHHLKELDINGKTINIISCDYLIKEINKIQNQFNHKFLIKPTNYVLINNIEHHVNLLHIELDNLLIKYNLSENNTINDFIKLDTVEIMIEELIFLICKYGILILNNCNNTISQNHSLTKQNINDKLNEALTYINTTQCDKTLNKHIKRLYDIGIEQSICPLEGIVFQYNNMLLKLTGNFTALLRIIGFFKYKK